ncbi:hypothetical protein GF342_05145 [Candidatus Woesearchaeota archaeon]|nr:hypothetical protein [Candidatus Woesearchaeota archaeon]
MGFLDLFRGKKKKKESTLPVPSPVKADKKEIPSDIPPIKAKDTAPPKVTTDKREVSSSSASKIDLPPPKKVTFVEEPDHEQIMAPPDVSHIFVSSDEYGAVIDKANLIRSKLLETDERLQKLMELRKTEEQQLAQWQDQLEGLEKKLTYMETVLAQSAEV